MTDNKNWRVTVEQNLKKQYVYSGALSAKGAELEVTKMYPNATVLRIERQNAQKKGNQANREIR